MRRVKCAAIIGLGLMGGSLARDLAARGVRVLGYDRGAATVRAALADGTLAAPLDDDLRGASEADVVLLAVPVSSAAAVLRTLAPHLGAVRLVTDVGSTKHGICAAAVAAGLGDKFIGSHPLAGDTASGWAASRLGLFLGAPVFLCPTPTTSADTLDLAQALWKGVGAQPTLLGAVEHDRHLAWVSHLPQIVSTALALALDSNGVGHAELGPGGRSVSRLAGSSPEMWADVVAENADHLLPALSAMALSLQQLHGAIAAEDREMVNQLIGRGRRWFEGGPADGR